MTHDSEDPLAILHAAKAAFGGSTEADWLVGITDGALRLGGVEWLEVGAGDGQHLAYQIERLSLKRRIRVVALDPSPSACRKSSEAIIWLQLRVEDYQASCQFHWINMRHCAYYMSDPVGQIERLSAWLCDGGAIALTHWSQDCVLYRLHCAIHGSTSDIALAGIESLKVALAARSQLIVSEIEYRDTELLVKQIAEDRKLALAVFDLARRGRYSQILSSIDQANFTVKALQGMPRANTRRNGVIFVRRKRD